MRKLKPRPAISIRKRSHIERHGSKYAISTVLMAFVAVAAAAHHGGNDTGITRPGWVPRIPSLHELLPRRHDAVTHEVDTTEQDVIRPATQTKVKEGAPKAPFKRYAAPDVPINLHDLELTMPVHGGQVFSVFGYRCRRIVGCRSHPAVDIAIEAGTPLFSAHKGTVEVGRHRELGHFIKIKRGRIETIYGHLNGAPKKSNGQLWTNGEEIAAKVFIGNVGTSGNAEGPHIHFSLLIDGKYVDPETYMPQFASLPRRAGLRSIASKVQ